MRKLITIFTILFLFCETGCTSTTTETTALNDINIEKNSNFIIPNEFTLEEHIISIGTDFSIVADQKIGTIKEKVVNLTTTFEIYDINNNLQARSEQELISWGTQINIFDRNHNKIGSIEEEVFKSLFKVHTEYRIFDKYGKQIAVSEKFDVISTNFEIYDMSNNLICKIKRPMINVFSDSWNVKMYGNNVDRKLLLFIPAYKTCRDNDKK